MRDLSWMVTRSRKLAPRTAPVTLLKRGVEDEFTNQRYPFAYVEPPKTLDGLDTEDKAPIEETVIVLYQEGQSRAPDAADAIREDTGTMNPGGNWVVVAVDASLRSKASWGVYRCTCRRTPYRPPV